MCMSERDFNNLIIHPVATIHTDFPTKFGIPRQSEMVHDLKGKIVFYKDYRKEGIIKGLEGFSYIYVIWGFSSFVQDSWSPTVRPPRLGGNQRLGVFSTRSPNRPNPLGLSILKIEKIEYEKKDGPCIYVTGIDMMDNTPIYDIKPYIPEYDSYPEAKGGFVEEKKKPTLEVIIPEDLLEKIPEEKRDELIEILHYDPHPSYQHDERKYGFVFSGFEIKFHIRDGKAEVFYIEKA